MVCAMSAFLYILIKLRITHLNTYMWDLNNRSRKARIRTNQSRFELINSAREGKSNRQTVELNSK